MSGKVLRDAKDIMRDIEHGIEEVGQTNNSNMSRDRPYDGQSHTDLGERGRQEVHGVTMRDLRDCYIRAIALSSGEGFLYSEANKGEAAQITENDIYAIDFNSIDPIAIQQNLGCEVERMMGIFPNLPDKEDPEVIAIRKAIED